MFCYFSSHYKTKSFNTHPYHQCVEFWPSGNRKSWSQYNNKAECEENDGKWILFHNYLEKANSKQYFFFQLKEVEIQNMLKSLFSKGLFDSCMLPKADVLPTGSSLAQLISIFVFCKIDSTILLFSKFKISILEQTSIPLLDYVETLKTDFLMVWLLNSEFRFLRVFYFVGVLFLNFEGGLEFMSR